MRKMHTQNRKNFLVSYMEKGQRIRFLVQASRKDLALIKAEEKGADKLAVKNVQLLNRDVNTY